MSIMDTHVNGYDMQMHTNVLGELHYWVIIVSNSQNRFFLLGHFYLTKLLLPALLSVTKGSSGAKARIVNVTSSAHYFARAVTLDFNTFKSGPARDRLNGDDMYIQSKSVCIASRS